MKHEVFGFESIDALTQAMKELQIDLPMSQETGILSKSYTLGEFPIKNRLLAQPIEGFDAEPDGAPSERSIRRYKQLAESGYGTIWMESISVSRSGRSNPLQLWLNDANAPRFREMLATIRNATEQPPFIVAQLTHSGRYSKPQALCAIENPFIPKKDARMATDDDIRAMIDDYISVALATEQAGFNAIDIRACHGYFINELFSAYHRDGCYGGSFENRTRMLIEIIDGIRTRSSIPLCVRLNFYDGIAYPHGWGCMQQEGSIVPSEKEPLRLIGMLEQRGVRLINISAGIGACSPHVLRPYDRGGPVAPEHPLEGVARMIGFARAAKQAAPSCCIVASALTWLREYAANVAARCIENAWFDIAGFGRQSIAYPNFARDLLAKQIPPRDQLCNTCGGCSALIKTKGSKLHCIHHPID